MNHMKYNDINADRLGEKPERVGFFLFHFIDKAYKWYALVHNIPGNKACEWNQ